MKDSEKSEKNSTSRSGRENVEGSSEAQPRGKVATRASSGSKKEEDTSKASHSESTCFKKHPGEKNKNCHYCEHAPKRCASVACDTCDQIFCGNCCKRHLGKTEVCSTFQHSMFHNLVSFSNNHTTAKYSFHSIAGKVTATLIFLVSIAYRLA